MDRIYKSTTTLATDYDIIILTETWLTEKFYNAEVKLGNCNIYRNDRHSSIASRGTLIAVNNKLRSHICCRQYNSIEVFEHVFVCLPDYKCIVSSVYLPPTTDTIHYDRYTELFEDVSIAYPDFSFLAIGDFNLPDVKWNILNDTNYFQFCDDNCDSLVKNNLSSLYLCFSNLNINQFNNIVNNKNNVLDLCFSN